VVVCLCARARQRGEREVRESVFFFLLPPQGEREGAPESQGLERGRQAGGRWLLPLLSISARQFVLSHLLSSSPSPHCSPFLPLLCFSSNSSEKEQKKRFLVYRFLVWLRIRASRFRLVLPFLLPVWNPIPPPANSFGFDLFLQVAAVAGAVLDSRRDGFAVHSGLRGAALNPPGVP
jgi:hypothetical protein